MYKYTHILCIFCSIKCFSRSEYDVLSVVWIPIEPSPLTVHAIPFNRAGFCAVPCHFGIRFVPCVLFASTLNRKSNIIHIFITQCLMYECGDVSMKNVYNFFCCCCCCIETFGSLAAWALAPLQWLGWKSSHRLRCKNASREWNARVMWYHGALAQLTGCV